KALARTRLMPSYPGGDFRVIGELSVLGKFHEIGELLFERRLHYGSSSQHGTAGTHPDKKWLVHYWKGHNAALSLPFWSLNLDRMRLIARSRMSWKQKLSLTAAVLRHMRWGREKLLNELLAAGAGLL